jgi:hypothetical protein
VIRRNHQKALNLRVDVAHDPREPLPALLVASRDLQHTCTESLSRDQQEEHQKEHGDDAAGKRQDRAEPALNRAHDA